jgi:hypothetical protein
MGKKAQKDTVAGIAWGVAGAKTLLAGTAFWAFVATQVVVAGPAALVMFGTLAGSSAVGIGGMVGYCAKQAQKNLA